MRLILPKLPLHQRLKPLQRPIPHQKKHHQILTHHAPRVIHLRRELPDIFYVLCAFGDLAGAPGGEGADFEGEEEGEGGVADVGGGVEVGVGGEEGGEGEEGGGGCDVAFDGGGGVGGCVC